MAFSAQITPQFRLAEVRDGFPIMELYQEIYQGSYPDPLMTRFSVLKSFLETKGNFWFLAEVENQIVGSVIIRYDQEHHLAKAFGAVVRPGFRGERLMERLLSYGMDYVNIHTAGVDVVYATTRTVHSGAQVLTERLGFKKLGIFPNSHKTSDYETHCLAAFYYPSALEKRVPGYKIHDALRGLVELVMEEVPSVKNVEFIQPDKPSRTFISPPVLEMVESEHFVRYRYEKLKSMKQLQFTFFPFSQPNVLILSPDQSIEIFCSISPSDGHAVIIGSKVPDDVNFTELFTDVAHLLRDHRACYVELLIRADKPKVIDSLLKAKFIPSAFFPAFQYRNELRHDYVVLSRTFEIFDFKNIELQGLNQKYLEEYFKHWKRSALNPNLLTTTFSPEPARILPLLGVESAPEKPL